MATGSISFDARNAELAALASQLAGGSVELRTAPMPANADAAATGTLIATITLENPAFNTPASGSMTLITPTTPGTAIAAGTIAWARFKTSGAVAMIDADVGLSGSGALLIATKVALLVDETANITSYTHTIPRN